MNPSSTHKQIAAKLTNLLYRLRQCQCQHILLEILFTTLVPLYYPSESVAYEQVTQLSVQAVEQFLYQYTQLMIHKTENWMKLANRSYFVVEDIEHTLFTEQKSMLPRSWKHINKHITELYGCCLVDWLEKQCEKITPTLPEDDSATTILWPVCHEQVQQLIIKDGKRTVPFFHSPALEWLPPISPPISFESNEQNVYQYLKNNQVEDFHTEEKKLSLFRHQLTNPTKSILDIEEEQKTLQAKYTLFKSVDISHITKLRKQHGDREIQSTLDQIFTRRNNKLLFKIKEDDQNHLSVLDLNNFSNSFSMDQINKVVGPEFKLAPTPTPTPASSIEEMDDDQIMSRKKMKI